MGNLSWERNRTNRRAAAARRDDTTAALSRAAIAPAKPPPSKALTAPVEVSRFWRNRSGECVVVTLEDYEGRAVVNARVWYTDRKDGVLRPGRQGLCLSVHRLPELSRALAKALKKARELGLIDPTGQDVAGDGG
jgi:hypothetical protein